MIEVGKRNYVSSKMIAIGGEMDKIKLAEGVRFLHRIRFANLKVGIVGAG